jgi:hypothetical protein
VINGIIGMWEFPPNAGRIHPVLAFETLKLVVARTEEEYDANG